VYIKSTIKGGSVLRLLGVWADHGNANGKGLSYPHRNSGLMGGSLGAFGGRLATKSMSQAYQAPQFQYVQCISLDNEVGIW